MRFYDHCSACLKPFAIGKKLVSVRDGVLRYMGHELGLTDADGLPDMKFYNVYRTADTIKALLAKIEQGLDITIDHVDTDFPVPEDRKKGRITNARLIELDIPEVGATVGIEHDAEVSPELALEIEHGVKQVSFGYTGKLRPYKDGYEQYDLEPHHEAVVPSGRCGESCSFKDKKQEKNSMKGLFDRLKRKNFKDEDPQDPPKGDDKEKEKEMQDEAPATPTMEEITAELVRFGEVYPKLPMEELMKLYPLLKELNAAAESYEPKTETPPEPKAEEGKAFTDKAAREIARQESSRIIGIMTKAQEFLPDTYNFADKAPEQIMRDALATQMSVKDIKPGELEALFRHLKKDTRYQSFGDSGAVAEREKAWAALAEKDL